MAADGRSVGAVGGTSLPRTGAPRTQWQNVGGPSSIPGLRPSTIQIPAMLLKQMIGQMKELCTATIWLWLY